MPQPAVFVPHDDRFVPADPPAEAARKFYETMRRRRSVRMFAPDPVERQTIEWLVRCAGSAPSGANKQPWRFVCVADPALKHQIRLGAEEEERAFYRTRAPADWLAALAPLGTDEHKEFLEIAPWLIVAFKLVRGDDDSQLYYIQESIGLACGLLLAAAQHAGLATLTHTPSPMGFLNEILGRPKHEKPFLLIPVGYAAKDCVVPKFALSRKPLSEIAVFL